MKYLCLIYTNEADQPAPDSPEYPVALGQYMAFGQEVVEKGVFVAGDPLESAATATTVKVRDGKTTVTDGPYAETKEQLGGFYILDCKDLDEALSFAAKIPGAKIGEVEVRPIVDLSCHVKG